MKRPHQSVVQSFGMNTGCVRLISALFAIPLCVAAAQAPHDVLPKNDAEVTMPFFVLDKHGNSMSTMVDLSVLDNKMSAQSVVAVHSAKELPLRLGVLIDTSNSGRRSGLYQPGMQGVSDLLNLSPSLPARRPRRPQHLHRVQRSFRRLFVLEVGEHVAPGGEMFLHASYHRRALFGRV